MKWLLRLALNLVLCMVLAAWIALPALGVAVLAAVLAAALVATRRGRQALSVAQVGLSTLTERLGSSAVIVIGIAGVVGVLVALLAMGEGYRQTLSGTGNEDTAMVLRGGSGAEVASVLARDSVVQITDAAGIAHDAGNRPLASPEIVVAANLHVRGGLPDDVGSVQLRGVGEQGFAVRPGLHLVEGRRFTPGLRELVVGRGALRQFDGLQVGKTVQLGSNPWTVVGVFDSGDAMDSELWGDANVVADAYRRGASRTSVVARLQNPAAMNTLKAALADNPQLSVDATTTLEFYAKQSEGIVKVLRIIGMVVGSIMGVGAVFGALNTMFAAVAARAREIATLRAIGFGGMPVVAAILMETLLLALVGGIVGGLVAWILFDGYSASTMAAGSVGKLSFALRVTPELMWTGIKWALAIGFIGGLFPAVHAANMSPAAALRQL
ncbi:MAG: ABC transporter permease [Burkholderiaceae bacterium]|nr:ABC transporter permease [Roseateles sp.]MBV8471523.1 ABC transporter permease [Burkholderiaceae bacterium]